MPILKLDEIGIQQRFLSDDIICLLARLGFVAFFKKYLTESAGIFYSMCYNNEKNTLV